MEAKGAVEKLYCHFKPQRETLGKVMHLHKAEVGSVNKKVRKMFRETQISEVSTDPPDAARTAQSLALDFQSLPTAASARQGTKAVS